MILPFALPELRRWEVWTVDHATGWDTTVNKFKIGQSVRLRPSHQTGRAGGEYRIVRQLPPQTDGITRYRVRSSADNKEEVVVKEGELQGWKGL
jgi:hypothetical protein